MGLKFRTAASIHLWTLSATLFLLTMFPTGSVALPQEDELLEAEAAAMARHTPRPDNIPAETGGEKVPGLHVGHLGFDKATGEEIFDPTVLTVPPGSRMEKGVGESGNLGKQGRVDANRIRFRSGLTVELEPGIEPAVLERLSSAGAESSGTAFCLIQFVYPFPTEARTLLEEHDVVFYDQAGVSALYAKVPADAVEIVETMFAAGSIRSVGEIPPAAKVEPGLVAEAARAPGTPLAVIVLTFDEPSAAQVKELETMMTISRRSDGPVHIIEGWAPGTSVSGLAQRHWVRWLEPQPVMTLGNLEGSMGIGSDVLRSFAFDGTDVEMMVVDTGIARSGTTYHPDLLAPRILDQYDYQNADTNAADDDSHGTHVAGSIGGRFDSGNFNSERTWQGVTPDVDFLIYKLCCGTDQFSSVWFQQSLERATSGGRTAHVSNNSWGGSNGTYTTHSEIADRAVRGEYNSEPINMVIISHNDNDLARAPSTGKNVITVGSVKDGNYPNTPFTSCGGTDEYDWAPGERVCYSNFGPIDTDGDSYTRVKPDVMAPGAMIFSPVPWYLGGYDYYGFKHGTSMAAPHVSGTVAQILDAHSDGNPWLFDWPMVVKAMLLASAVDVGGDTDLYGRGLVDPYHSIYYQSGVNASMAFWGNSVATTGELKEFTFSVPEGAEEVIVVLTWADPAGANEVDNDLDIFSVKDGGDVTRGGSSMYDDPVEFVRITQPFTAGTWTITVKAYSLSSAQAFGLVAHSIISPADLTITADASAEVEPGHYFYFHQYINNSGYTAGGSYARLHVPTGFVVQGVRIYTDDDHSHYYDDSELYHPAGTNYWRVAVGETLAWYERHVRWYIRAATDVPEMPYVFQSNAYWRVGGTLQSSGPVFTTITIPPMFADGFESGNTSAWSASL